MSVTSATATKQGGQRFQSLVVTGGLILVLLVGLVAAGATSLMAATAPVITDQPANQVLVRGQAVTISAAASGDPVPTVLWHRYNNASGATGQTEVGTTATIAEDSPFGAGIGTRRYEATFTNEHGTVTTDRASVQWVTPTVGFTEVPQSQTVVAGDTVTFTAAAQITNVVTDPATFSWQTRPAGSTSAADWQTIADASGASFTLDAADVTTAINGYQYRAVASVSAEGTAYVGSSNSAAATLYVVSPNQAPLIVSQPPGSLNVEFGATTGLITAAAIGDPEPDVQWQSLPAGATEFSNIPGATSQTLELTGLDRIEDDGTLYRAVFSNANGTIESSSTQLAMLDCVLSPASPNRGRAPMCGTPEASMIGPGGELITFTPTAEVVSGQAIAGSVVSIESSGWPANYAISLRFNDAATLPTVPTGVLSTVNADEEGVANFDITLPTQQDFDFLEESYDTAPGYNWFRLLGSSPVALSIHAVIPSPYSAPSPPAAPSVAVSESDVTVNWAAPAETGGLPLTDYTVQLTPVTTGSQLTETVSASTTSFTFEGVATGTYTATVVASNATGDSAKSPASGPVTVGEEKERPADAVSALPYNRLVAGNSGGVTYAQNGSQRTATVPSAAPGDWVAVYVYASSSSSLSSTGTITKAYWVGWFQADSDRQIAWNDSDGNQPPGSATSLKVSFAADTQPRFQIDGWADVAPNM